ncbi:hypothetical protein [Psychrobacter piscatorii]|uniref:Uncharacterized protein n=1 Tax=Psychrobacter piscatorii TaxID=554343 RepID=A0A0T6DU98_9GAMM|nr:hypothetical protein [Psychrobacter piscatorii]KRU23524.1 hypothetical protein AS194_03920 [Psychrobacter piscatorii]
MSKLITRFEIGFDDETKAEIAALKGKLDEVARGLLAKKESHADGLLAAMQAEAANDAPESELLQLGQWVFEGQDEKWKSAALNSDGRAFRHNLPSSHVYFHKGVWRSNCFDQHEIELIDGAFDTSDFLPIQIDRETVNDVDYLSETVPEIQGMEASDIIIDELGRDYSHNSNCLSAIVPQITQADMQLIFIKNLSDVLIQRMHSMDRFSEDDYAIGGDKLIAWDILIYEPLGAYAILMRGPDQINVADLLLIREGGPMADAGWNTESEAFATLRTITEAELPAFRAALEACYA